MWQKPNPSEEHKPADKTVRSEMLQPKVTASSCLTLCSQSKTAATKQCPCFRLGWKLLKTTLPQLETCRGVTANSVHQLEEQWAQHSSCSRQRRSPPFQSQMISAKGSVCALANFPPNGCVWCRILLHKDSSHKCVTAGILALPEH